MKYSKDVIDEFRGYTDWHQEWRGAVEAVDFGRTSTLLSDAKAMGDPDHHAVFVCVLAALDEGAVLSSKELLDFLLDLQPYEGWPLNERLEFIAKLFSNRLNLTSNGAVALLGDWISEYVEVDGAKRQMTRLLRDRPAELGDVLFSMKTRLFPRLAGDDAVNARRVYDHIYSVEEETPAEWVAQQFEAIWPAQSAG